MFQIQNIAFAAQCEGKGSCSTVPNQAMTGNSMLQKTQKASRKAPVQRKEATTWYLGLVKNAKEGGMDVWLSSCDKACNGVETNIDVSSCYCHEVNSAAACDGKSEGDECTHISEIEEETVGYGPGKRIVSITNKCATTTSGGLWCPPTGGPGTHKDSSGNYDLSGLLTDLPGIDLTECGNAHCQEEGQSCAYCDTKPYWTAESPGGRETITISESKCEHMNLIIPDPNNWYCNNPVFMKLLNAPGW